MLRRPALAFSLFLAAAVSAFAESAVQVLIITGDESIAPYAYAAAAKLAGKDPSASNKSGFRHLSLGKDVFLDPAALKKTIMDYSNDPRVRGIVVSPAVEGTASAFRSVKEKRDDVICAAIDPAEGTLLMESCSDFIIGTDVVARAVRLARLARQCGLTRILLAPSGTAFSAEEDARFYAVLAEACAETGIALVQKPPKASAEDFVKGELGKDGGKALLWSTAPLGAEVLRAFLAGGNYALESSSSSLIGDYSRLFSQDPKADGGDFQKTLKRYEKIAIDSGFAGRMGSWIFPEAYVLTVAASEFIRKNPGKKVTSRDLNPLLEEIQRVCPGAKPALSQRIDPETGVKARNHYQFKEDIYALGRGFLVPSPSGIQEKYQLVKPK